MFRLLVTCLLTLCVLHYAYYTIHCLLFFMVPIYMLKMELYESMMVDGDMTLPGVTSKRQMYGQRQSECRR